MTDDEICALLAEVTPGPWAVDGIVIACPTEPRIHLDDNVCLMGEPARYPGDIPLMMQNWDVNARFIAAARDLVPALLARAETADAETSALRAKLDAAVALLREARSDLAGYVDHDYPEPTRSVYPSIHRRWKRDMGMCWEIDATLDRITGGKG